jgi:hypothetical protein
VICRVVLLGAFALALFSFVPVCTEAQEAGVEREISQMVGENYLYSIDFLFFTRLAEGELRLSETDQPDVYRAELIGRTLGVASWLSGDRTQTYTSKMELAPDGSLRSIEHTSRIVKRKWGKWRDRVRLQRYDYDQGIVFEEKSKEGAVSSRKEHKIPADQQPVDMLTAFYNLRAGIYGPLVRGAQFLIPTCSGKGFSDITVTALTVGQQAKQEYFPSYGLLLLVTLDPEVFDSDSGNLYFWLNDAGVPERGIVEDIIGTGDVRGSLVEENL